MATESARPSQDNTHRTLTIIRIAAVILAVAPVVPFPLFVVIPESLQSDLVIILTQILTYLGALLACVLLPVLTVIGVVLVRKARAQGSTQHSYLTFILIGIVWLVYLPILIALTILWLV